jgi:hypothetical protein
MITSSAQRAGPLLAYQGALASIHDILTLKVTVRGFPHTWNTFRVTE